MNKLFKKISGLALGLALTLGAGISAFTVGNGAVKADAAETLLYTLDTTGSLRTTNNSYAGNGTVTNNGITWDLNGNGQINPWRLGGKAITATNRTLSTTTKFSQTVTKVKVYTGNSSKITLNSIKLDVGTAAKGTDLFAGDTQTLGYNKEYTYTSNTGWTDGFYTITVNVTNTSNDNGYIQIKKVEFYGTVAEGDAVESVSVSGDLTKKVYNTVENWDLTGLNTIVTKGSGQPYDGEIYHTVTPTSPAELAKTSGSEVVNGSISVKAEAGAVSSEAHTIEGIKVNYATAAEALNTDYTGKAIVKGVITKIDELSTQYGNATYHIGSHKDDTNTLKVYRGKALNDQKITEENYLEVGDSVVVYGDLAVYDNKNQLGQYNYLLSLTKAENVEPDIPVVPDPEEPEPEEPTPTTPTVPVGAELTKVTANTDDWTGTYAIVYEKSETEGLVFDYTAEGLDKANNYTAVTLNENKFTSIEGLTYVSVAKVEGGYSIKTFGDAENYIGNTSDANALKTNASNAYVNTITLTAEDGIHIVSAGSTLRFNFASNQMRFRYFKSSSFAGQGAIELYRYGASAGNETEPDTPVVPEEPEVPAEAPTDAPIANSVATFEFGANRAEKEHSDGSDIGTETTFTVNEYTLSLENVSKVYKNAYDAIGYSCIKLGTGSVAASFSFTVPADINQVVILVAGYKASNGAFTINEKAYETANTSNSGIYESIVVDTTSVKTIAFTTTNPTRLMINTIAYIAGGTTPEPELSALDAFVKDYLHMDDIATSNQADTGACRGNNGYYALAIVEFEKLEKTDRAEFFENDKYQDAEERLTAWATANGEIFNATEYTFDPKPSSSGLILKVMNENNSYVIIIIAALVAASALVAYLVINNKRKNSK